MATTPEWHDGFSVGVRGLDRQHRELLARIGALFEAIGARASGEELESHVALLKGYAHTHFACEERLMRWHGYPLYARHLGEHQRFVDALAWTDDLYDRAGPLDARVAATAAFLSSWLSDHFEREDRELAEFLRQRGARLHAAPPTASGARGGSRRSRVAR